MVLSSMLARLEIEIKATHTIGEKREKCNARRLSRTRQDTRDRVSQPLGPDRKHFAVVLAKMLFKWPLKVFSKVFSEMTRDDMGNLILLGARRILLQHENGKWFETSIVDGSRRK